MEDVLSSKGLCSMCREEMTTISAEVAEGKYIYVCETCLEATKQNFVWICMHCGNVYIRPKSLVLKRIADPGLKRAYLACEEMQMIQGIDLCIECDPQGVMEFAAAGIDAKESGHC